MTANPTVYKQCATTWARRDSPICANVAIPHSSKSPTAASLVAHPVFWTTKIQTPWTSSTVLCSSLAARRSTAPCRTSPSLRAHIYRKIVAGSQSSIGLCCSRDASERMSLRGRHRNKLYMIIYNQHSSSTLT